MRAIRGDGAAALADCNKALDAGKNLERYDSRGFAYLRLGDYGKAIDDYTAALAAEPNHDLRAYPLYGRGVAKLAKGDNLAGGKADIEEARRLDCEIDEKHGEVRREAVDRCGPGQEVRGEARPARRNPTVLVDGWR